MYMCMSEVHTACTYACQRCTPYVHAFIPKVRGCWVRDWRLKVFQPRLKMKDLYNMRILPIRNDVSSNTIHTSAMLLPVEPVSNFN